MAPGLGVSQDFSHQTGGTQLWWALPSWAQARCLTVWTPVAWLPLQSDSGAFVLSGKASENSSRDSAVKPTGAGAEGWKWRKLTISLKTLLLLWSPVPSEAVLMSWSPLPGPLLPATSLRAVRSCCRLLPVCGGLQQSTWFSLVTFAKWGSTICLATRAGDTW